MLKHQMKRSISLVNLLFAGFRSVVATMWSISDVDGPDVAGLFYERLRDSGALESENAAGALHYAAQTMRARSVPLKRWVPFIHVGL